ncbi:uncharacterized protein LOC121050583 [Rosa chinensis]|uniref:uncharacterized protein LOC121050583 n=1 Tax=Rosa chinensis TaxID=74649 RepID=UPI001AD8FDDE|nr:uncharacterized protein LOC121050583 [Rosa chinensis]
MGDLVTQRVNLLSCPVPTPDSRTLRPIRTAELENRLSSSSSSRLLQLFPSPLISEIKTSRHQVVSTSLTLPLQFGAMNSIFRGLKNEGCSQILLLWKSGGLFLSVCLIVNHYELELRTGA